MKRGYPSFHPTYHNSIIYLHKTLHLNLHVPNVDLRSYFTSYIFALPSLPMGMLKKKKKEWKKERYISNRTITKSNQLELSYMAV